MGLIGNKIPIVHKMFTTISSYCASSTECVVNVHRKLMTVFQYEMKFNKFGHAGLGTSSQRFTYFKIVRSSSSQCSLCT